MPCPPSKRLLKARKQFKTRTIAKLVDGYGAHALFPREAGRLFLLTPIGKLTINVCDGVIYTCFDVPELGWIATIRICQYGETSARNSGKWNFYYHDDVATLEHETITDVFFEYIGKLMDCHRRLW